MRIISRIINTEGCIFKYFGPSNGVNLTFQDLLRQDARIQDLYFNIFEIKLSITSLFSVQIISYLGVTDIIYSDVIDAFFQRY